MSVLEPAALRELLFLDDDPLSAGFTPKRQREILEAAVFYGDAFEQSAQDRTDAAKYRKLRVQNVKAQRRWRRKKEKGGNGKT